VSTSTPQSHYEAHLIYSHCVEAHFLNVKVELVALIQPDSKTGSKKVENVFQNSIRFQILWLLPRQIVVESGAQALRLSDYSRRELTIKYLQSRCRESLSRKTLKAVLKKGSIILPKDLMPVDSYLYMAFTILKFSFMT
jgi:hypothetical protein